MSSADRDRRMGVGKLRVTVGKPSSTRRGPIPVVVCDGRDFSTADLATIEALARLGLGARRMGARLRVDGAPPAVRELIDLCGLGDAIRCEERGPER